MQKGKIKLATGPMFSGKTTWLIKQLEKEPLEKILSVYYYLDNRYAKDSIATHDGKKFKAISAKSENDIIDALKNKPSTTIIGLDELQFFDPKIHKFLQNLRDKNVVIFTAGLNVDHNNVMWETTRAVMPIADKIYNFKAICAYCGRKNATITNRKGRRNERIVIGGSELYESLCEKDYQKAIAGHKTAI